MPLSVGDKLGHYEVLSLLGQGGMGEVYRAKDTRLGRDVAIKVLPQVLARDPERLARFEREAKVLASLDHPNIGHIHGIVDSEDSRGLVLALVEGPTLSDRIEAGPMAPDEAIAISKQIIEALEYAHERGVVHRDLKPANIKITSEGVVKVLDFGLAKVLEDEPPPSSLANSPTLTMGQTRAGVILGTAAYMSPEQAVGRTVDRRSDIFSFGAVLYEMLAGKRAFLGAATPDVLEAVVKNDPDWSALPAATPGFLRRLLKRTLAKDRKQRLQAIGEARIALENLPTDEPPTAPGSPDHEPRKKGAVYALAAVAGAATILAAVLAFVHFREAPPAERTVRFQIPVPEKFTFNAGTAATISPDGRWIAFPSIGPDNRSRMYFRALDSVEVKPVEGSEGDAISPPPFWSPDSRFIVYGAGGKLKKSNISGGPPQTICDASSTGALGAAWSRDGVIVYGSLAGALMRVSAAGGIGTPVTVLAPGETAHRYPQFLPDGRHFLYQRIGKPDTTGVYIGSIDVKPEQQSLKPLLISDRQAEYAPSPTAGPGWLLFMREGSLMAQSFNADKLELSGNPMQVAPGVGSLSVVDYGFFSLSENGVLLYRGGAAQGQFQLIWTDAQGNPTGTLGDPGLYFWPAISPDGSRVAVSQSDPQGNDDIWVLDVVHGTGRRLTFDPAQENHPLWTPDGTRIVFTSDRGGHRDLYVHAADGSGVDQLLLKSDEDKTPTGFSKDGRYLLYDSDNPKTRNDIWLLPMEGERKPIPLVRTEFREGLAQFSPDGHWIAYTSTESRANEVYVKPFSPGAATEVSGSKSMVSKGGGVLPRWRGKQLVYYTPDGKAMAVDVTMDKTFQFGVPNRLFQTPAFPSTITGGGDISEDGKRFLFVAAQGSSNLPAPFTVVLNWFSVLKE